MEWCTQGSSGVLNTVSHPHPQVYLFLVTNLLFVDQSLPTSHLKLLTRRRNILKEHSILGKERRHGEICKFNPTDMKPRTQN